MNCRMSGSHSRVCAEAQARTIKTRDAFTDCAETSGETRTRNAPGTRSETRTRSAFRAASGAITSFCKHPDNDTAATDKAAG